MQHIIFVTRSRLQLNYLIWRTIKKAHIPASKEPIGLSRSDGKRPDGATLVPRSRWKLLAWDVTVSDTYAASHIKMTAISASAAAEKASNNKRVKYNDLATTHIFVPIAVETSGAWRSQSAQFVEDLGRRITAVTNEPLETTYLYHSVTPTRQCNSVQQHFPRDVIFFHHSGQSCSVTKYLI